MFIRVLGPLSIHHGGVETVPTAGKPCTVLALLLLNHGRVVPVAALTDELWRDVPPRTARTALQIHVLHLRKQLARAIGGTTAEVSESLLQTVRNGYRFVVDPARFDLELYHGSRRAGVEAIAGGDFSLAGRHFRRALDLWRGPVVADVEPGVRIRAEAAGLAQSRLTTLDYRIEIDLRAGLHREMLSELAVLTARNRFHENLHVQYMVALYRAGYRLRALEAFHRLRQDLQHEFRLEPSRRARELHQAMLVESPDVERVEVVPLPQPSWDRLPPIPVLASSF